MRSFFLLVTALLIFVAIGCAPTTPNLDSRFGDAVNTAKAQQTINPDAARNPDPVAGLDGTPATDSIDRYRNTFKEPVRTFTILNSGTK